MRTIERASACKRVNATARPQKDLDPLVAEILAALLVDQALPEGSRDHALSGDWAGYRECHLKPDLPLIYRKPDPDTLRLARLGSHSELFG